MIERSILSPRYLADDKPLQSFSSEQAAAWATFKQALASGIYRETVVEVCFFCNSRDGFLIAEKDRYGNRLQTVICRKCGILRSLNQLDESSTADFYTNLYRDAYADHPSSEIAAQRMAAAKSLAPFWAEILDYLRLKPQNIRVFEIGAGGGWNLYPLSSLGASVSGCDFGTDFVRIGREFGLEIFDGGVETFMSSSDERNFDILLLIDVLEHTLDPYDILCRCNDLIRHGGYLVLGIPPLSAAHVYWGGDLLTTLQNAHNYTFDFSSIKALARKAGFELVKGDRLTSNAIFQKINLSVPRREETPLYHGRERGHSVLRYLRTTEAIALPYWRLFSKIFPGWKSSARRAWRIKIVHLVFTCPDVAAARLRWGLWRIKRRIMGIFRSDYSSGTNGGKKSG